MKTHTVDSAPAASKPAFEALNSAFGWSPNVLGVFAGSPVLIQSYLSLFQIIGKDSAFTEAEQEIIQIANNIDNDCGYCMAAHSTVATMKNLFPEDQLQALRDSQPLADPKHEALRSFALLVLREKGRVSPDQVASFKAAGFTDEHVLEIITHTAFKVITNFTNNLADPALDQPFQAQAWPAQAEPQACSTGG